MIFLIMKMNKVPASLMNKADLTDERGSSLADEVFKPQRRNFNSESFSLI